MKIIIWIVLLLIIFGCKKEDEEQPCVQVPNCSLCDYAKSLEGLYRGKGGGYAVTNNPNIPYNPDGSSTDSLTISVQHIFLPQSTCEDSTKMYFETEYWYDIDQIHKFDTIEIINDDGFAENNAYLEYAPNTVPQGSSYWIKNDTIKIRATVYNPSVGYISVYSAFLLKQ